MTNRTARYGDETFIVELTKLELGYLAEDVDVRNCCNSYRSQCPKAFEEISTETARKAHDRNRDIAFAADKVVEAQNAFRIAIAGELIQPQPTTEEAK